jgi:hypothetical protein
MVTQSTSPSGPFQTEPPSIKDLATEELTANGPWIVANIVGAIYWTLRPQKVRYRGLDIFVLPITQERHFPGLAARVEGRSEREVRQIMSGFLSALCWVNGGGALVKSWTGGSQPIRQSGFSENMARTSAFEFDNLPDPQAPEARLALALCREASAVNLATYSVITYFRVFEIHFQGQSREIKDWINANLNAITDHGAATPLAAMKADHADVGDYLYGSCRSAAAHGKLGKQPVIDPDDPEDEWRLGRDLPVIRALAIKLTEEILGVKTLSTLFKDHLYELAGFRALFGEALAAQLAANAISEGHVFDLPVIDLGLMDEPPFAALSQLHPVHLGPRPGGVEIVFQSSDQLVEVQVVLDFQRERLLFDCDEGIHVGDDGSAGAALAAADALAFLKLYWGNGRLKITDTDSGELLSRKDAFIPVNMFSNPEGFDANIQHWKEEAVRRAAA